MNNIIDENKKLYISNMRKELCDQDIVNIKTGALNLKYFNVKKGQYWSKRETKLLIKHILIYDPTQFNKIKNHVDRESSGATKESENDSQSLGQWTETEIRLRVCKLLKVYDLEPYKNRKFTSEQEIVAESHRNLEKANKDVRKKIGGIYFNPPGAD